MSVHVLRGLLMDTENYEGTAVLGLGKEIGKGAEILAEKLLDLLEEHGETWSVRYFITEEQKSPDELDLALAKVATGLADIDYHMWYSEITGYLWTDEEIVVGGHDLLTELMNYTGKWLHLEIEIEEAQ